MKTEVEREVVGMAKIVVFPSTRRVGAIGGLARRMASYSQEGAERTLAKQLSQQRDALIRKGITPEVATREVRSFELAVRAQLWGIIMRGDGDAA
jgi:hypothetical protein